MLFRSSNFDTLHAALEEVFNVDLLNRLFYSKIQRWFFWAIQEIAFPHGGIDDPNPRNRMAAIRLLTRVIFCWFACEKRLVPSALFVALVDRILAAKRADPAADIAALEADIDRQVSALYGLAAPETGGAG